MIFKMYLTHEGAEKTQTRTCSAWRTRTTLLTPSPRFTLDKTQIIVKYSNIAETYITSLPRLLFSSSHTGAAVKSGEGTALTHANNYNRNKKWKQSNVNRIRML